MMHLWAPGVSNCLDNLHLSLKCVHENGDAISLSDVAVSQFQVMWGNKKPTGRCNAPSDS